VDEQNGAAGWLTLAQAAGKLGISIYTVRRQVKRGELEAQQVATRHGLTWLVRVGELPGDLPTVSNEPEQVAQALDTRELLRMLDQRDQTIMELAGRVGFLQAELRTAREQLALLPPAEPAEVAPTATPEPEATPGAAQRAWWRFW
jgi:hypothetical protein